MNARLFVCVFFIAFILVFNSIEANPSSGFISRNTDFGEFETEVLDPFHQTIEKVVADIRLVVETARDHIQYAKTHPEDRDAYARAIDSSTMALLALDEGLKEIGATETSVIKGIHDAKTTFKKFVSDESSHKNSLEAEVEDVDDKLKAVEGALQIIASRYPRGTELPPEVESDVYDFSRQRRILLSQKHSLNAALNTHNDINVFYQNASGLFTQLEASTNQIFTEIATKRAEVSGLIRTTGFKTRALFTKLSLEKIYTPIIHLQRANALLSETAGELLSGINSLIGNMDLGKGNDNPWTNDIHDHLDDFR
jgi:hypothetical protein